MNIRNIIKFLIVSVILFFLARSIILNWGKIKGFDWSFNPVLMILAFIVFFAGYMLLPWIFSKMLGYLGNKISYKDAWDIYYVGNMGKYIPGKVWAIAGITYMAEKAGVPVQTAGTAAVLSQIYSLLSSSVFFIIFLICRGFKSSYSLVLWFIPVSLILLIFLFPKNLEKAVNFLLSKIGRKPLNISISSFSALKITFFYFISWLIMGSAFWLLASSFAGTGMFDLTVTVSIYVVASVIGFIAFFAPGGIGVREGMLGLLFINEIPLSIGIVIAVISRLMVTFIEIINVTVTILRKGLLNGSTKARKKNGNQ